MAHAATSPGGACPSPPSSEDASPSPPQWQWSPGPGMMARARRHRKEMVERAMASAKLIQCEHCLSCGDSAGRNNVRNGELCTEKTVVDDRTTGAGNSRACNQYRREPHGSQQLGFGLEHNIEILTHAGPRPGVVGQRSWVVRDPVRHQTPVKPEVVRVKRSYEDDQGATYVGSFPKGFGYGPEEPELEGAPSRRDDKPRILLMGLRRSGKSSIQKVVFHKVSPNETLFLESTNKIIMDDISNSSFVQFQIWDIPGQIDFFDQTFDSEYIFGGCGALIFVIDAQDDYMEALSRLQMAVTRAHKINESIKFEVFIHKVDGLSDDNKIETQRDILQRATDELADAGMDNIRLSFHLTSIYDHSIFEAFSKVVQKLIPQLSVLENLLDIVISNSKIEKAFLFDVVSKIYIATDTSPVDMQCYELCCDMIDVVIDMSCIYGVRDDGAFDNESASFIKLNSSTVLFLREVNRHLALVCILREDGCENRGIIEYNFKCFRNAIQEVFVARNNQALGHNGTAGSDIGLTIGSGGTTGDPRMDRLVKSPHSDDEDSDLSGVNRTSNGLGHGMLNGMVNRDDAD